MTPLVRPAFRISLALIATLAFAAGCGNEIGDSCSISTDCSPRGDRICDRASPGGYCTVLGCDYDTCPEESVCVRFFPSAVTSQPCASNTDCTPDELCTLAGTCAPRTAELRYCMKSCGDNGDCRGKYECRDRDLMIEHGGEPVLAPDDTRSDLPKFCAPAPVDDVEPSPDPRRPDGGPVDAGAPDASPPDAGAPDASAPDASAPDAA